MTVLCMVCVYGTSIRVYSREQPSQGARGDMTRNIRVGQELQSAIDRSLREEMPELPAEHKARLLHELLAFYRKNQATIDLAVEGARQLACSAHGAAQIARLESMLRGGIAQVDSDAVRGLLRGTELQPFVASAQAQGVAAVSVGVSLGLSLLLIGGAAGADAIVKLDDNKVFARGFGVVDVGLDVFAGIGLNIGVWQTLPIVDQKTYIGGLLLDIPGTPIRIMAVREGSGLWAN